jgi:hypothetical protein
VADFTNALNGKAAAANFFAAKNFSKANLDGRLETE